MPDPLTIKRPKVAPWKEQVVAGIVVIAPLAGLIYLWQTGRRIHFDQPWVNLAVHALLIIIPLAAAALIQSHPLEFKETEETCISTSGYFDKFAVNWWMMFPMLATPVFAIWVLGYGAATDFLPHPDLLATSAGKATAIMALIFILAFFYGTLLSGSSEPRTLVSPAGIRTGMLRFHKWEDIHHLSREGNLYALYHRVNPALPATGFRPLNPEMQALLERYLTEQRIEISNATMPLYQRVKVAVVVGFFLNLALSVALQFSTTLSPLWIIVISFGCGIVMTLLLEQVRGVSKYGKTKPVIEPEVTETPSHFPPPPPPPTFFPPPPPPPPPNDR